GTTTVTCSAGETSCTFTVTVNDCENPTITCPQNIVATLPNCTDTCVVETFIPIIHDNCPDAGYSCDPASGSCFPVGTTTVTCTVTDASHHTASCQFQVSIGSCQPCSPVCGASDVAQCTDTGVCTAVVNYTLPPPDARCPDTVVNCDPQPGSTFSLGA